MGARIEKKFTDRDITLLNSPLWRVLPSRKKGDKHLLGETTTKEISKKGGVS
jgi:hypothetical protein